MRLNLLIPILIAALLALMGSVYVVAEGHTAIVLNLGRVARTDIGPGLHFKWPMVETALVFDRRLQVLDATPERYLTSERSPDTTCDSVRELTSLRSESLMIGARRCTAISSAAGPAPPVAR